MKEVLELTLDMNLSNLFPLGSDKAAVVLEVREAVLKLLKGKVPYLVAMFRYM